MFAKMFVPWLSGFITCLFIVSMVNLDAFVELFSDNKVLIIAKILFIVASLINIIFSIIAGIVAIGKDYRE